MADFNVLKVWGIGMAFTAISLAIIAYLLDTFLTIFTVGSIAYTIVNNTLTFLLNMVSQLPTAGKILAVMVLIGIVGGIGVLGYDMYQQRKK